MRLRWAAILSLGTIPILAQQDRPLLHFGFEKAGLAVPHYEIDLYADGEGVYRLPRGAAQPQSAIITVRAATVRVIFAATDAVVSNHCGTREKNLADEGTKLLEYFAAGVRSSCSFNYSDDEKLRAAAEAFQEIAETVQAGARLEQERRFDRLGLDAEVDSFTDLVKAGHAIEVQNIAPVLKAIANDDRVMDRVRRKAARLLQDALPDNSR